ncbi:hypothetical protein LTR86_002399 [Recurvomyces mirabilis]|nr:hypothetical protein LTR86_002399 [Recurvomyces mirabilis]
MFECNACTLRAIRAIAGEVAGAGRPRPLILTPHLTTRKASTATQSTISSVGGGEAYLNAAQRRHLERQEQASQPKSIVRRFDTRNNDEEAAIAEKRIAVTSSRHIRKELEWLKDPAKLAEHVHYTLRCNEPEKAMELCRTASKDMQCVVSWNHVVDWNMKQGRIQDGLKVYNEMKKRAQFPDGHTYTLLLRGLVGLQGKDKKEKVPEEHVSRAVSIYQSMSSPTSRVKPSIIHTNAVLKVCAFGRDMDALWAIASKLPEVGGGAADHITYSIILNALRYEVLSLKTEDRHAERTAQVGSSVNAGRKVWMDVVQKWRSGQIKVDEELVCAMARLLLLSERINDHDDVLNLVQQTMQVERQVEPIDSTERHIGHVPGIEAPRDALSAETIDGDEPVMSVESSTHEHAKDPSERPDAKAYKTVKPLLKDSSKPKQPVLLPYTKPGNDTLSVLLDACSQMRVPKAASAYWKLLTSDIYGLQPDLHNFHAYLRFLMTNRSSGRAAEVVLHDLPKAGISRPMNLTFRLAMDACVRDSKNMHVLENATKIVDAMEKALADPDVVTLKKYLSLALNSDSGPKVVAAIDRLDPLIHNLRSRLTYGPASGGQSREVDLKEKTETLDFFRAVVGAVDTCMNRGLVPREDYSHWHSRRSQLNTFIGGSTKSVERSVIKLERAGRLKEGQVKRFENGRMQFRLGEGKERTGPRRVRDEEDRAGYLPEALKGFKSRGGPRNVMGKGERRGRSIFADSPADIGV